MARGTVVLVLAAGTSLLLNGCGGSSDTPSSTTSPTSGPTTTTSTTTTTMLSPLCASGARLQDARPNAEGLLRKAVAQDECCALCHADEECVAWVFLPPQQQCKHTLTNATWVGMVDADLYVTGTKNVSTCADCSNCGLNEKADHRKRDCSICSRGENWNQYPCFLSDACRCGGPQTTTTPRPTPKCSGCKQACWLKGACDKSEGKVSCFFDGGTWCGSDAVVV